jgi:nucleotidyltransferase substrate binding protein (TIGR01987 family)
MSPKIQLGFQQLGKALIALEVVLNKPMDPDRSNIDATIHRFEFTIELYWKLLKRILESLGKEVTYPKVVLKEAFAGKLIDDELIWLSMLNDRNQTSHTYNEEIADEIYLHIKNYFPVMNETFRKLQNQFYEK